MLTGHDNATAGAYTAYSLPTGQTRPTRMRLFASLGGHFLGLSGADATVGGLRLRQANGSLRAEDLQAINSLLLK